MPDGVSIASIFTVLLPVCLVTMLLRGLPFLALSKLRGSAVVTWLGLAMPVGVMLVLVVYSLHTTGSRDGFAPVLLGLIFTVVLHLWRRNASLSILLGTAFYAVLVNLFF